MTHGNMALGDAEDSITATIRPGWDHLTGGGVGDAGNALGGQALSVAIAGFAIRSGRANVAIGVDVVSTLGMVCKLSPKK